MTYDEMKAIIQRGCSVAYHGQIISRVQDLPSPASLAKGNPDAEKAVLSDLQAQMAELQAQLALLQKPAAKRTKKEIAPGAGNEEEIDTGDDSKGDDKKDVIA